MYYKYKVTNNKLVTSTVRSLLLELDPTSSKPLLYQPGQYAAITLNDKARPSVARCFSIASSPSQQRQLEFGIRIDGVFTSALERLKKGDEVLVRGPFGNFILNETIHQDVVMLAGGIGIAPFLSMIRYATSLNLNNKINLIYSCRSQDDIAFYDELISMTKQNPNLKITYVISKGPTDKLIGQNIISGRLTGENIDTLKFSYAGQTFMICGPSVYISSMHSLLLEKKVPNKFILAEAFGQGSVFKTDEMISWPFNMYLMTGVVLVLSTLFVMASDLYKILPGLNIQTQTSTSSALTLGNIPPQISTKITQAPIIKIKPSSPASVPVTPVVPVLVTKPATTTIATTTKTIIPAPAPKKTVVPVVKPRTTVS